MTIIFKGQALFTKEPTEADRQLIRQMLYARQKWEKEGRPQSNKWM